MNEKILIIPEIHTKFKLAEDIIYKENPDKIIFLGDYFDDYYDDLTITEQTAYWLKESMQNSNRIHLLGNHDLSYLDPKFTNSGFSEKKYRIIQNTGVDLTKLLHYYWIDDWLCTHAGLSNKFYKIHAQGLSVKDFLNQFNNNSELRQKLYACSPYRGGSASVGGIIWCDYKEFVDIPNVKQIFGHTKSDQIRWKKNIDTNSEHLCLDTELHNYVIYKNNTMEIKSIYSNNNDL